ncbi:nickel insertion protein, partial [Enterocloster citroniae]
MGKILYLECNSGISGDMTVGALLDLGADRHVLEHALGSLGVGGYHLHFGRKNVCGLDSYDFDVHLEKDGHGHSHEHGEGHGHSHEHGEGHGHSHEHGEGHGHSHGHGE